jgi:hypothetical protein
MGFIIFLIIINLILAYGQWFQFPDSGVAEYIVLAFVCCIVNSGCLLILANQADKLSIGVNLFRIGTSGLIIIWVVGLLGVAIRSGLLNQMWLVIKSHILRIQQNKMWLLK